MPALDHHRGLRADHKTLRMDTAAYEGKLAGMEASTLLPHLDLRQREFVRGLARTYRFTYQELRQVAQTARDLSMWQEEELPIWWERVEATTIGVGRDRKKALLQRLAEHLTERAQCVKVYPAEGFEDPPRRRVRLREKASQNRILGPCPAYSEETVCCGLHTLDAVRGCPYSCSYCTIQTFYGEEAELEADLATRLSQLELDSGRRYHIGTGQASDSLVWGNRGGILDALLGFAASHPNVLLELKTKAGDVSYLEQIDIPTNVVCSWTLNTDPVTRSEERGAASLGTRIRAARRLADRGVAVAFHFHPMVLYAGWLEDYPDLATRVQESFSPSEIAFISMGTVTLIKPVIQEIRRRGGQTKILQMEMVRDHNGKLTYPDSTKIRLYQTLYTAFCRWQTDVFFYLCMETAAIWEQALGFAFPTNAAFEEAFLDHCLPETAQAPISLPS